MKTLSITLVKLWLLLFCSAFVLSTNAQSTEVMLLGTTHLQHVQGFEPPMIDRVLEQLRTYHFDAIGIESMSTELLYDIQSRQDSAFRDLIATYGEPRLEIANSMQATLGYGLQKALKNVEELLNRPTLSDSDRVVLIQNLLAAGDLNSATLQMKVMENPDLLKDRLDSSRLAGLAARAKSNNEISSIALPLALESGIEVLDPIDDLQDEPLLFKHFPEFVPEFTDNTAYFTEVLKQPVFRQLDSLEKACVAVGDLLPLYLYLNSDEYRNDDYAAQWHIWLESAFPSKSDRSRYALWEMRNLMIAARIMKLAAFHPGERILIIIGASHTSFLEKYLSAAQNIELIPFQYDNASEDVFGYEHSQ